MSLTITIESRKSRQGHKRNVPVLVLYDVSWLEKIGEMRMWVKSEKSAESEKYVKKDELSSMKAAKNE